MISIAPSLAPKQLIENPFVFGIDELIESWGGSVIVKLRGRDVQPLASVTVTPYVPGPNPDWSCELILKPEPSFVNHEYE